MIRRLLYIACVLLLFCGIDASAQKSDIRFRHLTINDGLSQSAVNSIMQDRYGFMWIGTQDGLNRYDGYRFQVFKNDRSDSSSLANNYVWSVYEDAAGNLWVGSEGGLQRYDRATETFIHYPHKSGNRSEVVWSIIEGPKGRLWIGTSAGLERFDPKTGNFESVYEGVQPGVGVRALFVDSRGILWAGSQGAGLWRYHADEDRLEAFRHDPQNPITISNDVVWSIAEGKNQNLWVGTNEGIDEARVAGEYCFFDRYYADPDNPQSLGSNTVASVYVDQRGAVWAGTRGGGLNKIIVRDDEQPEFHRFSNDEFMPYSLSNNLVQVVYEDRSGNIWVGHHHGIDRFDPAKQGFTHYTGQAGDATSLPEKNVWCFWEDAPYLWVGTRAGLSRLNLRTDRFAHFTRATNNPNRLDDRSVLAVLVDEMGETWVGMVDGVYKIEVQPDQTAVWTEVIYRDSTGALADNRVYVLFEDSKGYLWIGTREGISRYHKTTGEYQFYQHDPAQPNSIGNNVIRCVHEDKTGRIWIGTDGGGLNLFEEKDGGSFQRFMSNPNDPQSISSNEVISIAGGANGELWLGTYGGGLCRFDPETGTSITYSEKEGLSNNVVYGVVRDDENKLWLSTNFGLSRFDVSSSGFRQYTEADGLQSNEFNIGAYYRNEDGRMYFGGINGFNAFYPHEIRRNDLAPQMVLTDLKLFNRSVEIGEGKILSRDISLTDTIELNYDQSNLTIDFAALHYTNPELNQYRYILEDLEEDYNYVGNRPSAYYTHLEPGEYTFRVSGTNSDGKWAEEEATLFIIVHPPFWQTWWFRVLCLLLAIGIAIAISRYRISIIKAQKQRLEVLVARRTKEVELQKEKIENQKSAIEQEKEKAENLLLNILPSDTVDELKANGKATARSYRRASVLFTDFKGFTQISEQFKATELVNELDRYFVAFDRIIERWDVEKIKTVGDAYMAAGGVPIRNRSNPIDTVLAALEINRYMAEVKKEKEAKGEEAWPLRIGIHTGEIIAGVIGTKRFAYDIWGDTVNVANRMETSGEPGKVNISGATYEIISPLFECTYRGKVHAKNKGEVDMYFVEGIKPELSENGEGIEPNKQFYNYVNLLLYSSINYRNAERYIVKKLEDELPPNLHYHGVHHTLDVTKATEMYAHYENITGEDLYLLKTAALYHDAGFVHQYSQNEPVGVEMSKEALPRFGYTPDQIEVISELILATRVPHDPKTHLDQIMCDADLDYLGRDDFHQISESLKRELMDHGIVKTDRQWDEIQVKFFNMHRYFTNTAMRFRQEKKMAHLELIKARLEKGGYADGS